ncbi:hypothetical protein HPP92_027735 [Vanilla planifolia]|uniref:Transcriptional factor DELLA N-terminal domain-containing protein n=1 Tax=Vanilla planifolia TaxID=51239 RepID=A0A835PDU0_VANPL|nr:hypothetical protein HPP92_027735 [Vanilla planifolia]KAG0448700.1 hypothetical protein HPP92_027695 [Vanilla planifolia]
MPACLSVQARVGGNWSNPGGFGKAVRRHTRFSRVAAPIKEDAWVAKPDSGGRASCGTRLQVRSSDMADVAQKLEQLEMAIGRSSQDDAAFSIFLRIPFNPSDLSN